MLEAMTSPVGMEVNCESPSQPSPSREKATQTPLPSRISRAAKRMIIIRSIWGPRGSLVAAVVDGEGARPGHRDAQRVQPGLDERQAEQQDAGQHGGLRDPERDAQQAVGGLVEGDAVVQQPVEVPGQVEAKRQGYAEAEDLDPGPRGRREAADQQGDANMAAVNEGVGESEEAGTHQQEAGDLGEPRNGQADAVAAQGHGGAVDQAADDLGGDQGADKGQGGGGEVAAKGIEGAESIAHRRGLVVVEWRPGIGRGARPGLLPGGLVGLEDGGTLIAGALGPLLGHGGPDLAPQRI